MGKGKGKEMKYESTCCQILFRAICWANLALGLIVSVLRIYDFIYSEEYNNEWTLDMPFVKLDLDRIVFEIVDTCLTIALLRSIYRRIVGQFEFSLWLILIVCFLRVGDNLTGYYGPYYIDFYGALPFVIARILVLSGGFFYKRQMTQCGNEESLPLV